MSALEGTPLNAAPAASATSVVGAAGAAPPRSPAPDRRALRAGWARACALVGSVRWFVRELMGDSAYDKYVARHRLDHPDHEPMSSAQWWRAKADAEASAPQTRCC